MNMDKFLISILFSVFISLINLGIFNVFQEYDLIYVFLIHGTTDIQVKNEIHLPNNLNRFYMFFH